MPTFLVIVGYMIENAHGNFQIDKKGWLFCFAEMLCDILKKRTCSFYLFHLSVSPESRAEKK